MIPDDKIEEIRDAASIVDVVGDYVSLTRKGQNHLGLCPFHSEKTPSFTVNEDKKLYHCFGCNASGNVITFLMEHDNLTFPEVVRTLAERYGITIEERTGPARTEQTRREIIGKVNRAAVEYFVKSLNSSEGKEASKYLESRGFSGELAERFRLGYAAPAWSGLVDYLAGKGFDPAVSVSAGLIIKRDKAGGHYDRFRDRLMIPITDARGTVVAFGGRSLDGSEPKYLNSPESTVFKKGELLYGFYQARGEISKLGYALVVEGYFDLIALHARGFANTVATMGTALTEAHLRRLRGYGASVYTLFDSDEAGRKAALRGLKLFLKEEVVSKVVLLPPGMDPDDFLKEEGEQGMKRVIGEAISAMDFFLDELAKRFDIKTGEGKASYLDEALAYLALIKNVAERGHYAGSVAITLGLEVKAIYEALKYISSPASSDTSPNTSHETSRARGPVISAGFSKVAESTILKVVLNRPAMLSPDVLEALKTFKDPLLKEVADGVSALYGKTGALDPAALMDYMKGAQARGFVSAALVEDDRGFIDDPARMLDDCMDKLKSAGGPRKATVELMERLRRDGLADLAEALMGKAYTEKTTDKGDGQGKER